MLEELKHWPNWVVRRSDKVPLNPRTGELASVTNPLDWSDFHTAWACCSANNTLGLGFVLTDNDPYCVIDLDDANGVESIIKVQQQIAQAFNSYSEVSPSGKGLHIWIKANIPSGKRKAEYKTEVYSSGRYMTVTFDAFNSVAIADRQELAMQLWEDMGGVDTPAAIFESIEAVLTDDDVCRLCANGSNGNGEMFLELYKGSWQNYFPSQSEADLALCNILAFYTDDKNQVVRIFRTSELGKRKKALRDDYFFNEKWGLVTKAFDQKTPIIDLSQLIADGKQKFEAERLANEQRSKGISDISDVSTSDNNATHTDSSDDETIDTDELEEPKYNWTQPPGLIGEIATFIYYNAVNPVKEVAVAASIAYMAGIAGRGYNYSRTGLNQYVVLLANTAGGKEGAAQGMNKLTHAVREFVPAFERFIGPAGIASPQALIKQLVETPCFLTHKDEFGIWLQKITSKYARGAELELRGMLLALFGKSGAKETFQGMIYSDRQKNSPSVDSPALSIFGDSTQQEFYKALSEDSITEGLVPRLTVIESSDDRPTYNEWGNFHPPSPELITKLASLGKRCLELELLKSPIHVRDTPEAKAFSLNFREYCVDQVFEDRESPVAQIWSRAHLRMIRLAALVAVGVDMDNPIVTLEYMEWAKAVIVHGVEVIQKRYLQGKVGEKSLALEQRIAVSKLIRKFCKSGAYTTTWDKAYGITKDMWKARVVTHRYLLNNTYRLGCFKNDHNPAQAFRSLLAELEVNGNLQKIDMAKVKNTQKHGVAYYVTDINGLAK